MTTLPPSPSDVEIAALRARVLELERTIEELRKYKHAFYSALGQVDGDTVMAWLIARAEKRQGLDKAG